MNFIKTSNDLQRIVVHLIAIRERMLALPTTHNLAKRIANIVDELEKIDEDLADADHMGTE